MFVTVLVTIVPGYRTFIDNKFFVPFGRLAFSVYISQIIPMAYYFSSSYEYVPQNRYAMVIHVIALDS